MAIHILNSFQLLIIYKIGFFIIIILVTVVSNIPSTSTEITDYLQFWKQPTRNFITQSNKTNGSTWIIKKINNK